MSIAWADFTGSPVPDPGTGGSRKTGLQYPAAIRPDQPAGPVTENHVIASRKAAWQSASFVVRSTTRPLKGPEKERIATA